MELPPTPDSTSAASCVPYSQASLSQVVKAQIFMQQELKLHFPALAGQTWVRALDHLQPDLWVEGDRVSLDYADLAHLTHYLAGSAELPTLEPPIYVLRAAYLAKRLVNYWDQAIDALADIEAAPLAYGPRVYNLVLSLALGNSVADEVFQTTHSGPRGRPGSPNPAATRVGIHARIQALRLAREEFTFANVAPDLTAADQDLAS